MTLAILPEFFALAFETIKNIPKSAISRQADFIVHHLRWISAIRKNPEQCQTCQERSSQKGERRIVRPSYLGHDGAADLPKEVNKSIEELEAAVRARDDFLAMAVHELRNPITPIQLCVQLLRITEQKGDYKKLRIHLETLERLLNRFMRRTDILLDLSRITSGKVQLVPTLIDLSTVVREMVSDLAPLIAHSGSELSVNLEEHLEARLDAMAVQQIIENLLSNAIKYGQGKPIEVNLRRGDGIARIEVRDHGIGISAEEQSRIFMRFERAVENTIQSGFGIGLWVSRNLAEALGGSIMVSGQKNAGSVFVVTLPLNGIETNE